MKMAERVGFEPTIELPLYSISNAAPSTTRPSLRFDKRHSNNILRFQEKIKANPEKKSKKMAERGGFEPPVEFDPYDGLANRSFRPLRHLSASVYNVFYTILRFPNKIKEKREKKAKMKGLGLLRQHATRFAACPVSGGSIPDRHGACWLKKTIFIGNPLDFLKKWGIVLYREFCSRFIFAPVAQLDRASDYGSEGWGFKSLRVHQF